MKTTHDTKRALVLGLMLPLLWTAGMVSADARPPRAGMATATHTGPAGNSATRQTTASTSGQGSWNKSSTLTGPNGNSGTRQAAGVYDPATKTYTKTATSTGPNGNSASSSRTVTATPAAQPTG